MATAPERRASISHQKEDAEQRVQAEQAREVEQKTKAAADKASADRLGAEDTIRWLAFYGGKNDELRTMRKQYSADVDGANAAGWTALHMAAWHNQVSSLIVLLDELGANIEAKNEFGWTPLMAATLNARTRCMKELLVRGAAADACANTGKTPKDYAIEMRHDEVRGLLEKAESATGLQELKASLLPPWCLWYVVSCPASAQEEVLDALRRGRTIRAFAISTDGLDPVRVAEDAWKSWRMGIINSVLNALRAQARTTQVKIIFIEDKGSKLCKDEFQEWASMRKGFDFQVKALQRERELAHTQAGGEGDPPFVSVSLYGDGPITVEAFRERFGGP